MPKQFWVILSVLSSIILSKLDSTNMARNKSEPSKPCDTHTHWLHVTLDLSSGCDTSLRALPLTVAGFTGLLDYLKLH